MVGEWLHYAYLAVEVRKCTGLHGAGEDNLTKYAGYLTLIGPPSDPATQKAFSLLNQLLLARGPGLASKGRIQQLGTNLGLLPVEPKGRDRVVASVEAAGAIEDVEKATFPVAAFVTVALRLPDAKAYVEVLRKETLDTWRIATVFSEGMLRWAEARYRGVVGELANPEYRDEVRRKIKTVT